MTSFVSPLLYRGTTLAFFHGRGKCTLLMLALQMFTICGAIISALSLSSLQLIPSNPVALVADIFRSGSDDGIGTVDGSGSDDSIGRVGGSGSDDGISTVDGSGSDDGIGRVDGNGSDDGIGTVDGSDSDDSIGRVGGSGSDDGIGRVDGRT